MKLFKKVTTMALSILLTGSLFNTVASAQTISDSQQISIDNIEYTIENKIDNEDKKVVEVKSANGSTTAEFNKDTGEINITENGELIASINTNFENTVNNNFKAPMLRSSLVDSEKDLRGTYAFWQYNDTKWVLQVPTGGDVIYQNSNNKEYLNGFADAVREMLKAQVTLVGIQGSGVLGVVGALIAAAPATLGASAVVALIAAAGVAAVSVPYAVDWYFAEKKADKNYRLA